VVRRGKTPVLTEDQARLLLGSIKVARKVSLPDGTEAEEPWLVGVRDRALMAVMTYSFARIGGRRHARRGLLLRRQCAGGCAFTRKAASATKCRRITTSMQNLSTPTIQKQAMQASFQMTGLQLAR
jgi:hypothetical protein